MEEQPTPTRPPWGAWLKAVAGFVAPTTLLTGLLLFFGFAYTDSLYEYFGIDPATLGLSTQDYLLRSAGALYMPVGVMLAAGLVGALGFAWVSSLGDSRPGPVRRMGQVSVVLIACGAALFVLGMLGGFQVWLAGPLDTPLLLVGGLLLVVYGRALHLKTTGHSFPGELKALAIVAALIALSSFWAVQAYAQTHGYDDGRYLARHLRLRPAVVVDTPERLYFGAARVQETSLPEAGPTQKYRYRYRGLRLLAQSGNRMFLIPDGWTRTRGAVIMIPADGSVRVAFRPG
ncbi:hypothetical protein [Streptomyces sp. BPTC-684]|uniref:hypothetical protein n=1 Tax=Streptomyces sp. BPTC-684 TaxID=3043734 RepID=UPI0024B10377|nr:hypothetical protein [Streptomyces sp. BPTC-684]WHM38132.1 hypothetical protein QIY60_15220 [Streptomyces sp. BPTC-684]